MVMKMKDLLMLYRNYLFALQEREEFGDKYGDTEELIKYYEKILKIKKNNGTTNDSHDDVHE